MLGLMENKSYGVRNIVPDALQVVRILYQHEAITPEKRNELVQMVNKGIHDKSVYEQFIDEVMRIERQAGDAVISIACNRILEKIEDEILIRRDYNGV